MNGKIKYIVVLLILGIYILAMFFFFGKPEEKKEEPYLYILAGPDTRWTYQGGGWGPVINDVSYNMKPFRVYIDNKDQGAYNVTFNDKFYFFNSNSSYYCTIN